MLNISIARWKGRIQAAFNKLLQINGLHLNMREIPDNQWPSALMALSQHVKYPRQKDLCLALMAKAAVVFCQTVDPSGKAPVNDPQEINNGKCEVDYWFRKDPINWGDKILDDVDYIPEIEAEARKRAKRKKTVLLSIFSTVAIVIAACIVYNLPYFAEKRAYAKVIKDPCMYNIAHYIYDYHDGAHIEEVMHLNDDLHFQNAIDRMNESEQGTIYDSDYHIEGLVEYINYFPQGAHIEEALRLKEDWQYNDAKNSWDKQYAVAALNGIDKYLSEYPEGRYADSVKILYNQIWDTVIDKYDNNSKGAPGRKYVHDMLVYMKEHNTRKVKVVGHQNFDLKEFSEYTPEIQAVTIKIYGKPSSKDFIPGRGFLKIPNDLCTIKDKITIDRAEKWTDDIVSNLQERFNNFFGSNLIQVVNEANGDCPTVDVNYVIKNQESWGLPDIWTYTEKQDNIVVNGAFYMGIALDFTADFAIPGSRTRYKVTASGDPGSLSFNNIDASMLYEFMCKRCLISFDKKIDTSLGLTDQ